MSVEQIIACDIGQAVDFTAVVELEAFYADPICERTERILVREGSFYLPAQYANRLVRVYQLDKGEETTAPPAPMYHIRKVERLPLGTPYHEIAALLKAMSARTARFVVDATGVGRPVVEMVRRAGVSCYAVTITGGNEVTSEGMNLRVPKRDLVSSAQLILQSRRLKAQKDLPFAETLVKELRSFRMKINLESGHDTYEAWRERDHDDIVLALAMGLWIAERHPRVRAEARRMKTPRAYLI